MDQAAPGSSPAEPEREPSAFATSITEAPFNHLDDRSFQGARNVVANVLDHREVHGLTSGY